MRVICKNCKGDNWDITHNGTIASCENCKFRRSFSYRKAKVNNITDSQLKALNKVEYWLKQWSSGRDLIIQLKLLDSGDLSVSINTVADVTFYKRVSLHCIIGRRGGVRVSYMCKGFTDNTQHFQGLLKKYYHKKRKVA
jgi:hypothetical protein